MGYSERARLYTRSVEELVVAREAAEQLRDSLNAEGVFQEIYES